MVNAPAAGADRRRPSPQGPVPKISFAKIGKSAAAPPSSTATMSSVIAPSSAWRLRLNHSPAKTESSVSG